MRDFFQKVVLQSNTAAMAIMNMRIRHAVITLVPLLRRAVVCTFCVYSYCRKDFFTQNTLLKNTYLYVNLCL